VFKVDGTSCVCRRVELYVGTIGDDGAGRVKLAVFWHL